MNDYKSGDMNQHTLIELSPVAEVANNLIDKLSHAIGWVFTHDTPQRVALRHYIDEIKNSDCDPLAKAALISNANKCIREYTNQHDIVALASHNISNAAAIKEVDDDWISQFMDIAKNVSNRDFQRIWAYIFSGECSKPGSIPKSLLFTIQRMDKKDADAFMKLSALSVRVWGDASPFIHRSFFESSDESRGVYKKSGINLDDINQLEALGLIKCDNPMVSNGYRIDKSGIDEEPHEVQYFSNVINIPKTVKSIPVGHVLFTKDGLALYRAVSFEEIEGFWEEMVFPEITRIIELETGTK